MSEESTGVHDPKPEPPREPEPWECCGSGCEPCVYDHYWEAIDRYEKVLAAWQARQTAKKSTS
jgi:hypothetical protein